MSATLKEICVVKDLDQIKQILMPENKTKQEIFRDDDWDNRWNWDTSELVYDDELDEKKNLWINECCIAISPFLDTLVLGRLQTISIFHINNSNDNVIKNTFNMVYTTTLSADQPEESITCILLLPFVSHQKSAANFRDWTAILCGFTSGFFRIYSENGKTLLSNSFHNEPVLNIECRTYSASSLPTEQTDEIVIVYPSAVIQIDGFTLLQTLRICRNRLSRSDVNDYKSSGYFDINDNQTKFTFKKWLFETASEGRINDCKNVCSFIKNNFDALVSHSISGSKTLSNDFGDLFITTGSDPYVGFFRAKEGQTHTIINELSKFLLNRVKNMFSFFNESGRKESESSIIQPSTLIRPDLNLFDERSGSKICLSPNKRLAAVTDNFGRIILFDLQNMIAVRIWKGYRKAEIGWITVNENERIHKIDNENERNSKDNPKRAFFLIFYVPKRGILEIWPAQTGPRVTAFNVGKNCRLIHLDFTMFGLNYLVLKNIKKSMSNHHEFENYFQQSRCFLFNYEKAQVFTLNIPFLCSFTDRNDKKARDVHVLKDLKLLFKKDDSNLETSKLLEKVIKLLLMLKTAEIRRESIEQLIKLANDCELIIFSLEKLRDHLLEMLKNNQLDFENKLIVQMCSRIIQLCHYYSDVQKRFQDNSLNEQFQRIVDESKNPPEINDLNEKLDKWSGSDLVRLLSLIAFRQSVLKPNVSNPNNSFSLKIGEFLNYFTLYYNHLFKHNQEDEMYEKLPIEVILMKEENKKSENNQGGENMPYPFLDTQSIQLERLSIFLFWSTFIGDQENIDRLLSDVCLSPSNLLLLLFNAWLNCSASNFWPCWPSFYRSFTLIIDLIVENAKISNQKQQSSSNRITSLDFSTLDLDDLHLSSSWTSILMMIYQSNNIPSTLIAIQVIKVLIARMKSDRKLSNDNADAKDADEINEDLSAKADTDNPFFNSDNEWETLHFDEENLSFLAKQLEDLFLLDLLLKSVSKDSNETNDDRKSSSSASSKNKDSISLSFILTNGPGIVSEIVARWAVYHNIEPDLLLDSKHCSESSKQDDSMAEKDLHEKDGIECAAIAAYKLEHLNAQSTLIEVLDHVRRCFPNCLDSDILLINCFWELLLQWNTEPLLKTKELSRALTYLVKVSSSVLRHNIASMSWRLFVQKRFATLCGLIEKMGKKPKDRISRKELEMDENDLESFCEFCTNLIDFMIRTSACSETDAVPLFTIDDWWQSFNSLSFNSSSIQTQNIQSLSSWPSNAPLALIAMHQKTANIDLLIEYYHLSQCIQFAVIFSLRNVRPFALFSSTVRGYFFQESLQSFIIDQQENAKGVALSSDPVLYESRMKFLSNVIVGIIQTLPINNVKDAENQLDLQIRQNLYRTANKWFSLVQRMAREWNLDIDRIRFQYVHDLYLYGCDDLAKEVLGIVSDVQNLSRKLLLIAGQRILQLFNAKFASINEISFLPTNVLFWLKSIVTDPNCADNVPLSQTINLLEKISIHLNKNDDDLVNYRICEELLLAMKKIDDENN